MTSRSMSKCMYIRTIHALSQTNTRVRNVDIARELGYSKPSVTNAMKRLCDEGFIMQTQTEGIALTSTGVALAEELSERDIVLAKYFEALGLDHKASEENAGRIGHLISDELFDIIQMQLEK